MKMGTVRGRWIQAGGMVLKELPLLLVVGVFLWAQYSVSLSVCPFLLFSRRLPVLSFSISIPFNLFWFSAVINLTRTILTGPGWLQSSPPSPNPRSTTAQDEDEDHQIPLLDSLRHPSSSSLHLPHHQAPPDPPPYIPAHHPPKPPGSTSRSFQGPHYQPYHSSSNAHRHRAVAGLQEQELEMETWMCKSDGTLRFCRKCNHYKADRSHHCSSCGRCVMRMDHHCPWLGGRCVGLKNHKFFVLFLVSTSVTAVLGALAAAKALAEFVAHSPVISSAQRFELAPLNWAFLVLVGGLFGMVLSGFTAYHLYLLSVNRTTIENMERSVRVRPVTSNDLQESYALLRTTRLPAGENLRHQVDAEQPLMAPDGRRVEMGHSSRMHGGAEEEGTGSGRPPGGSGGRGTGAGLPSYDLPIYKSDHQLTRVERRRLESGSMNLNLFDRGSRLANFQEVFGDHSPLWHWPLPIQPRGISNGYVYRINSDHLHKLVALTSQIRLLPNDRSAELRFERP